MGGDRQDVLSTYRYLRLAMVLVLGMLFVAVVIRALTAPGVCFEGSISAYYFTSVRAVFVGSLCALGTCLIVYRGNRDAEDIALNASGALAFVVAFVPTSLPSAMGVACSASNVPGEGQLDAAVNNNMAAYALTAAVAIVLAAVVTFRAPRAGRAPKAALVVMGAVLVAGVGAFVAWPEGFRDHAHSIAALGTFAGILVVVVVNALDAPARVDGRGSDERLPRRLRVHRRGHVRARGRAHRGPPRAAGLAPWRALDRGRPAGALHGLLGGADHRALASHPEGCASGGAPRDRVMVCRCCASPARRGGRTTSSIC